MDQAKRIVNIGVLDFYEGATNEGMRCIHEIIAQYEKRHSLNCQVNVYDVRQQNQIPELREDVFICSGGPGSPTESKDLDWENNFFAWIDNVQQYNLENELKKHIFFICHSFQMACRHFDLALVTKRKSTAFGVFPVHMTEAAATELIFSGLSNPFFAVDSRDYQVIQPKMEQLEKCGASILTIEKERPHVSFERAIMAIRFNPYMVGTQFHPEADAPGMLRYLQREDKKINVIEQHGIAKWQSMVEQLNDPDKIMLTYSKILPNFLDHALGLKQ
jgi:GMP synthase-like glutamine amidotransferase